MENTAANANALDNAAVQSEKTANVLKPRLHWIDIAKGICIIAVILGHLRVPQFSPVYSFHLTAFFILSGYTFRTEPVSARFLKNKFNRLMAPYFITCAAMTAMRLINQLIINKDFYAGSFIDLIYLYIEKLFIASGNKTVILGMDMGQYIAIGSIWFLPAMFFAVVIVQFLLNNISDRKTQLFIGIIMAAIASASNMIWLPASLQSALFAVPFILFGKLLKDQNIVEKIRWHHLAMLAAVYALCIYTKYAQVLYIVEAIAKDWLFTIVSALASSLLVIGLSYKIHRLPFIEFLGRNSLTILCVHSFEVNVFAAHLVNLRAALGIPETKLALGVTRLLFAIVFASLIVLLKNRKKTNAAVKTGARNISMDIMRAILIVLMIIGHTRSNGPEATTFIYSFHMAAFIICSGYFFKSGLTVFTAIRKTLKMLIPYAFFGILYILVNDMGWPTEVTNIVASMSFAKKYFPGISSIGPVYFITLLCSVRLIYIFVDRCKNELAKHCIVIALIALGVHLGKIGAWLPWSFDCALVCVAFYHTAHYMRKYDFLNKCKEHPYIFFPAACIWAYFIHCGGMELAIRNYGANVGLTILGAASAFVIVYMLCDGICSRAPKIVSAALAIVGQSTMYILIIHALFGRHIGNYIAGFTGLSTQHIGHLTLCILIQLIAGAAVYVAVEQTKKFIRNRSVKAS